MAAWVSREEPRSSASPLSRYTSVSFNESRKRHSIASTAADDCKQLQIGTALLSRTAGIGVPQSPTLRAVTLWSGPALTLPGVVWLNTSWLPSGAANRSPVVPSEKLTEPVQSGLTSILACRGKRRPAWSGKRARALVGHRGRAGDPHGTETTGDRRHRREARGTTDRGREADPEYGAAAGRGTPPRRRRPVGRV